MSSKVGSPSSEQPLDEVVAANVRRARENKGMSVAALAAITGHTLKFVQDLEKGEISDFEIIDLDAFATALGVEASDLVTRHPPA